MRRGRKRRAARRLLESGGVIAGDVVGSGLGFVFGGAAGAMAGSGVGSVLGALAGEASQRVLSDRERVRTGAVLVYAADAINRKLGSGARLRDDGFFERRDGRSSADEIAEGVALAARDTFEERKLPFLGHVFAMAAVEPELDAHLCAVVLRDAETLSWRQYTLLAAIDANDRLPLPDVDLSSQADSWTTWGIHRELMELYDAEYLTAPAKRTPRMHLTLHNFALREQRLASRGRVVADMLNLSVVPATDILEVHRLLAALASAPGADADRS